MLRVVITRIRGLEESLLGIRRAVQVGVTGTVDRLGNDMVAYARANHPWVNQTGRLQRAHKKLYAPGVSSSGAWRYSVSVGVDGADAYYAGYVEYRYDRGDKWSWMAPASRAVLGGPWAWTYMTHEMAAAFSTHAPTVRFSSSRGHVSPMWSMFGPLPDSRAYREHPGP